MVKWFKSQSGLKQTFVVSIIGIICGGILAEIGFVSLAAPITSVSILAFLFTGLALAFEG